MSNTPRLNWILFILYVLATIGVFVGAVLSPQFRALAWAPLRELLWRPPEDMPTTLRVAVPPALEGWAQGEAATFSRQNPRITLVVTPLRGSDAGRALSASAGALPDVWVAEAAFVRRGLSGIPYEPDGTPVAQDSLLWVVVSSRSDLVANLNWWALHDAAQSDRQFSIAMPPANSVEGLAACMSAAAEYHGQASLTAAQISDAAFQAWLGELLDAAPNRSRSPRDQLGSRPPEVDAGLILKGDWSQLPQQQLSQQPPAYDVAFDYPYVVRSHWYELTAAETAARQNAAGKFRDFLLGDGPQARLANYGFDHAGTTPPGTLVQVDGPALQALRACWQR